jgi:integrase/recombinase XerD
VAVFRQQQIQSPLDLLNGKARPPVPAPPSRPPVGRLQMHLRRRAGEPAVADVELEIINDDRFIPLGGIVVREPRPGWVTLEVPPLEAWEKGLRWLTPPQLEWIESPEFYKLIQEQATRRYLASKAKAP